MEPLVQALYKEGVEGACVSASPGAGKTRLLLSLCEEKKCLILAYNNQLAAETRDSVPEGSVCYTFHSLCAKEFSCSVRDDYQLESVVRKCENGEVEPCGETLEGVELVLIDEAQDVREVYVRLLKCVGAFEGGRKVVVAGDKNQLLYDFDPDFPATLDTLLRPHITVKRGKWAKVDLKESKRITHPACTFVNSVFGTDIVSKKEGPPVQVRMPKTIYKLKDCLHDVPIRSSGSVFLLVDRRKGNWGLKELLNNLSRDGVSVHVQGLDEGKHGEEIVKCCTYWGAKGLEGETVVVVVPGKVVRNPLYVALTRSLKRLVVVLDPREPHPSILRAVADILSKEGGKNVVEADASVLSAARNLNEDVLKKGEEAHLLPSSTVPDPYPRPSCLDSWRPRFSIVRDNTTFEGVENVEMDPFEEGIPSFLPNVVPILSELKKEGVVRCMEDVLFPTKMGREDFETAIKKGFCSRIVSPSAKEANLLDSDLREAASASYLRLKGWSKKMEGYPLFLNDLKCVSLCQMSWDGMQHVMRQGIEGEWNGEGMERVEWGVDVLSSCEEHDLVLSCEEGGKFSYIRVEASSSECCFHLCWEATTFDFCSASVKASLHKSLCCKVVSLGDGKVMSVTVKGEEGKRSVLG